MSRESHSARPSSPQSHPLPIAKSSVPAGVPLLAAVGNAVAYEWFYVEAAEGADHIVAIFSLCDPFRGEGGHREATLYLTWHRNGTVEDYAYALFGDTAGDEFRKRIEAFFSRTPPGQGGEQFSEQFSEHRRWADELEITVPSHALSHDLTLRLSWLSSAPDAPPRTTPSETTRFVEEVQANRVQGTRHVWQPLALGRVLGGRLFRSHARPSSHSETGEPLARRVGLLHDLPLAQKLQRKAKRPVVFPAENFEADAFAFENGAWCYVDHNAGFERLSDVGEPWMWWHARTSTEPTTRPFREIGYWFPRRKEGHLVTPNASSEGVSVRGFFQGRDPLHAPYRALFGVEAARGVTLGNASLLTFPFVIEAAPFYARLKAVDANGEHLGTLEALHPARLASPWTPFLMACRQLRVSRLGMGYGSRAFFETCRCVTAANGRSFYLASHVLPQSARMGAYVVYALCRLIDDATDEAESLEAALALSSPSPKNEGLRTQKTAVGSRHATALLDFLYPSSKGTHSGDATNAANLGVQPFVEAALVSAGAWSPSSVERGYGKNRARAFLLEARSCVRALGLERAHFEDLVAGQAMDEAFTQPQNAEDFRLYCYRVAGVVGHLMARVFGARVAPSTLEAAESLGLAMQITNILRDVREDFETRGRVYLPADACERHGVDVPSALAQAKAGMPPEGAMALVRSLGLQAINAYRTALGGVPDIPSFRARLCVRLMAAIYGAILGVILVEPSLPFRHRVVVPQRRRLWIALKVLCGASPLAAAGLAGRRASLPKGTEQQRR